MGMIGGGEVAFIGAIHRSAAAIDGKIDLVAGAFSQNEEKSISFGRALGLADDRCYGSYQQMIKAESSLPKDQRIDFVTIVTPNNSHYEISKYALKNGFHVFCEKPATMTLNESLELQSVLNATDRVYGLAHTYSAYPMILEARSRVARGDIGKIFKVMVDYTQGWLAPEYIDETQKQASWRLNPDQSGISCCMGDIGVHGANLAEFITTERINHVLADLSSLNDRLLDDDGTVLLKFSNGVKGSLSASQVCVGEENNLTIRIYGENGSLKWQQQEPNTLLMQQANEPVQILRNGGDYLSESTKAFSRTPSGHPQGYIEAFANLYQQFTQQLTRQVTISTLPSIEQAIAGMAFIEAVVESNRQGNQWVKLSA